MTVDGAASQHTPFRAGMKSPFPVPSHHGECMFTGDEPDRHQACHMLFSRIESCPGAFSGGAYQGELGIFLN